jgi:hypothetical protein
VGLRDLDDRLVPRLAERIDRVFKLFPSPPPPTGPLPVIVRLRRIDDRWTNAGPLALLREVPQLGGFLIAALILANGATAYQRGTRTRPPVAEESAAPTTPAEDPATDSHLGPEIGERVSDYLDAAKDRLQRTGAGQPDAVTVAVISFTGYQTPEEVQRLIGQVQVQRVIFRAPLRLPNGTVHSVATQSLVKDTRTQIRRVAAVRTAEAKELRKVADTIDNDPNQKADQIRDATLYEREAALLKGPCRCVFAVVVRTPYRVLLDLLAIPAVRSIDAGAPGGEADDYEFSGLLPEENATVTGGNQE